TISTMPWQNFKDLGPLRLAANCPEWPGFRGICDSVASLVSLAAASLHLGPANRQKGRRSGSRLLAKTTGPYYRYSSHRGSNRFRPVLSRPQSICGGFYVEANVLIPIRARSGAGLRRLRRRETGTKPGYQPSISECLVRAAEGANPAANSNLV